METETNSIRVLVVDDQRAMRKIIRQLLSQIGVHDVDDAAGELKTQIQAAVGFTI